MEEHVKEYNSLIEESPFFQDLAKQVELREAKRMVTIVVEARFPNLVEFAKECISYIKSMYELETFIGQIITAPDETAVKRILDTFVA